MEFTILQLLADCAATFLAATSIFLLSLSGGWASPDVWEFVLLRAVATTSDLGVSRPLMYAGSIGEG